MPGWGGRSLMWDAALLTHDRGCDKVNPAMIGRTLVLHDHLWHSSQRARVSLRGGSPLGSPS